MADTAVLDPQEEKTSAKQEAQAQKQREREDKKRNKGAGPKVVPLLILILIIGGAAWVVGSNQFGLRDTYVMPLLRQIPIINNVVPAASAAPGDALTSMTNDELIAMINQLQTQVTQNQSTIDGLNQTLQTDADTIANLKTYQDAQTQFAQDKAAFEQEIALNNPQAFMDYFQGQEPDNAAQIYQQVVGNAQNDKMVKQYISSISQMDDSPAAAMLSALIPTDMDLVVNIMKNLSSDRAAAILSAMNAQDAAAITKQMSPSFQ